MVAKVLRRLATITLFLFYLSIQISLPCMPGMKLVGEFHFVDSVVMTKHSVKLVDEL